MPVPNQKSERSCYVNSVINFATVTTICRLNFVLLYSDSVLFYFISLFLCVCVFHYFVSMHWNWPHLNVTKPLFGKKKKQKKHKKKPTKNNSIVRKARGIFRLHTSTTSLIGVSKCRFLKFMLFIRAWLFNLLLN